jgi:hypothetical protein
MGGCGRACTDRRWFRARAHAADPGDEALDTNAETGVGHGVEAAQVEIPVDGLAGQLVLVEAFFEEFQIVNAVAADNCRDQKYNFMANCQIRGSPEDVI